MTARSLRLLPCSLSLLVAGVLGVASAPSARADHHETTLREAFAGKFRIGSTISGWFLRDPDHPSLKIAATQFDTVTAANGMKWGVFNPQPGEYHFERVQPYIDFAKQHDLYTIGHCLFWHSQTPSWVYEDDEGNLLSREALLERMRERAKLYAEHWGDVVDLWDVVNESIEGDGSKRKSKFNQIIGDDFEEQARATPEPLVR